MNTNRLPSLEQLIRAKIQRRIVAAMILLFAGAVVVTVIETALSYSDLVARLNSQADTLQDLIISEVLVNNQDATHKILEDVNSKNPEQSVQWFMPKEPTTQSIHGGVTWLFPGTWTFVRPLKRFGDQEFGQFVFTGNFFTTGGLIHTLSNRLAFTVAICVLMAGLLLPIARKTPKELILSPVKHLLTLIRNDKPGAPVANPGYAEIQSIQDEFLLLMDDRRKLELQRLESEQQRVATETAQILAHDIRRPFSLLKATLDGLTQVKTPEAMQELLDATVPGVKKSLDHLDVIIADFTAIGSVSPRSLFSLSDAIRRGVELAAYRDTDSIRVEIVTTVDVKLIGVQNQMERVVANIVCNALQAMGAKDRVVIKWQRTANERVLLSITNTGSFISAEDLDQIFLPFFTKGKADGTGL